jgi:cytochrome c oxidase cbb3-type subunit IV
VDLSDLRTIVTTLSFIAFVGVVFWAYNSKQKKRFDEAANLPFVDADEGLGTQRKPRASGDRHE